MGDLSSSDHGFEFLQLSLSFSFFSPVARGWDNDRMWQISGAWDLAWMKWIVSQTRVFSSQLTQILFPVVLDFGRDLMIQWISRRRPRSGAV
jgi:hypothetical protein